MGRKTRREALAPDLTPLIDVVFLLLIFFTVSSVFKKDELALMLSLPTAEQGEGEGGKSLEENIELSKNEIAINGKKVDLEQLDARLASVAKKSMINLRVDGEVVYDRLIKVLDILQKYKLENLSLITEKK